MWCIGCPFFNKLMALLTASLYSVNELIVSSQLGRSVSELASKDPVFSWH